MFKERLKELRENKDVSQRALSTRLGLSQSTVGNWEAGTREPSLEKINLLADYFGVTIDYLLGRTEAPITLHTTNTPYMQVTPLEKEIIEKYRKIPRENQAFICRALEISHPDDRLKETKQA